MLILTSLLSMHVPILATQDDSDGSSERRIDELEQLKPLRVPIQGNITEGQNIDLKNYAQLKAKMSPGNHTIIAQVDFTGQSDDTVLQLQLNDLMQLIADAKAKCWQITGFTSLDSYLFVLLEAFSCDDYYEVKDSSIASTWYVPMVRTL